MLYPFLTGRVVKLSKQGDATPIIKALLKGANMKRDEIKTLIPEITDEQLNEVMRINGEDINKAKGDTILV